MAAQIDYADTVQRSFAIGHGVTPGMFVAAERMTRAGEQPARATAGVTMLRYLYDLVGF
jgi:hypothetical protein